MNTIKSYKGKVELAAPPSMTLAERTAALSRIHGIRADIKIIREALGRIVDEEQRLTMLGIPECVHDDMVIVSSRLNTVLGNPHDGAPPRIRTMVDFERGLNVYEANLPGPTAE